MGAGPAHREVDDSPPGVWVANERTLDISSASLNTHNPTGPMPVRKALGGPRTRPAEKRRQEARYRSRKIKWTRPQWRISQQRRKQTCQQAPRPSP